MNKVQKIYQTIEKNISAGIYRNVTGTEFVNSCEILLCAAGASTTQAKRAFDYAYNNKGRNGDCEKILTIIRELADIFAAK